MNGFPGQILRDPDNDVEIIRIPDREFELIREIARQNAALLAMNAELLHFLNNPMFLVKPQGSDT